MNSLVDQLFSSFGGYGLFLIAVLALAVWALAHFSAQPGTSVSILWGLVNYVKASSHTKSPKNTEIRPAPEKKSSITHRDQKKYEAGKSLVPVNVEKQNAEDPAETDIVVSADWLDGANERLAQFTDAQKDKKLEQIFAGKTIFIEGVVKNVGSLFSDISVENFEVTITHNDVDPDQMKKLESLHRGDAVRLRARPFKIHRHTVFCREPSDIERSVNWQA